jgi:hypothetical protein
MWQGAYVEHAAGDVIHDEEHLPDDALVFAQQMHGGHRDRRAGQRPHHGKLAIDGMRRGQQLAGWFLAQHIGVIAGLQVESRIRLPTLKLPDHDFAITTRQAASEVTQQRRFIEAMIGQDRNERRAVHDHSCCVT